MTASLLLSIYVTCCLGAVAWRLLVMRHSFYRTHKRWRDAPRTFVAACAESVFMGLIAGVGIALALLSIIIVWQALTA